ncbi:MAG TPA: PfkB family carbohydrate kinase [Candidatus Thermoplasmatota archaeon]|nr:PfkB family carbohydrate kinase [Candidatus Thermoplasmatota archaeon]
MRLTVVGTVAFDTLAIVKELAARETTGGVTDLHPDLPGGTAGNVAMALARLGAPPRLLACVGPDFAGSPPERALADAGVDVNGLLRRPTPTSRAYIFVEPGGPQVTYFYPGASRELAHAAPRVEGRAHFGAGEIGAYPALMRQASWVSFDPGQEVFHRDLDEIVACLPLVDLLFLNRHERDVLETKAGYTLERLLAEGPEAVVESRGADGTLVHTAQGRFAAPAAPATPRDPTGAGDAHRAGYLFATLRGAGPSVAARFANVLGAFAVEGLGAQSGHPTLAEALERYEKAYGEKAGF